MSHKHTVSKNARSRSPVFATLGSGFKPKLVNIEEPVKLHGSHSMFRDAALTVLTINSKYRRHEADLMYLKWFDYRFMTAAAATQKFIHDYERTALDVSKREMAVGCFRLSPNGLWQMSEATRTSFWAARQYADAHCMKYDFFIRRVMGYWFNSGQCGGKKLRLPRPNQLFTNAAMQFADEKWKERIREIKIERSTLPQYRVENYAGLVAQEHHKHWLIDNVKKCRPSDRPYALAKFIFGERLLSEDDALANFDPAALEEARTLAEPAPMIFAPIEDYGLFPACYGIPGVGSDVCDGCFQRLNCEQDATRANKSTAATGLEQVDERVRRLARERKRRERERKRKAISEAATS